MPGLVAIQRLERFDCLPVHPHPASGRQPLVEGVADEHVREPKLTRRTRRVGDDAGSHRLVQRVQQLILRDACEPSERVETELPPEHRSKDERAVALLREVTKAASDDVADALWDRDARGVGVQASLGREQSHDLANEERISLRLLVDPREYLLT